MKNLGSINERPHGTAPIAAAIAVVVALFGNSAVLAQNREPAPENLSIRNEVEHAMNRGAAWLIDHQAAEGYWSGPDQVAITALALVALKGRPAPTETDNQASALEKGYRFITDSAQPDGGIYRKPELINYNTALSTLALVAAGNPDYKPLIRKARDFLIGLQIDLGEPGKVDTVFDGGVGYGSKYKHSDMSNTMMALEALYYSNRLFTDEALADARDLNWSAAIQFIQNCQNLPSHNKQPWVADDPQNRGGFVYYPGSSMAGETNLASGRVALRSYGSISYAGLLSYIYADLKKEDPRVQAVFDWLRENFTLQENPGMGQQGLYYYFHTMAKALTMSDTDTLKLEDGRTVDWRKELALRLINLQERDGSWVNDNARWRESDPALVTSYAMIALAMIHRGL